jgi:hypothetical protein
MKAQEQWKGQLSSLYNDSNSRAPQALILIFSVSSPSLRA